MSIRRSSDGISWDVSQGERAVLVELSGELDLSSAGVLERRLEAASAGSPAVVVDLRKVTFIDSAGVKVLLGASDQAARRGSRVRLVGGPRSVHRVLSLMQVEHRLDLVDAGELGRYRFR